MAAPGAATSGAVFMGHRDLRPVMTDFLGMFQLSVECSGATPALVVCRVSNAEYRLTPA